MSALAGKADTSFYMSSGQGACRRREPRKRRFRYHKEKCQKKYLLPAVTCMASCNIDEENTAAVPLSGRYLWSPNLHGHRDNIPPWVYRRFEFHSRRGAY